MVYGFGFGSPCSGAIVSMGWSSSNITAEHFKAFLSLLIMYGWSSSLVELQNIGFAF
jgi:hypothetical protein